MAKTYIGQETVARGISTYMGNTHGELVNPNWCSKETLQAMSDLLGTPDDTGGGVGVGTIFARLNKLVEMANNGQTKVFRSPISIVRVGANATVNGEGVAYCSTQAKIVIDGQTITNELITGGSSELSTARSEYPVNFYKSVKNTGSAGDMIAVLY